MKLLLTSEMIRNRTLADSLAKLLDKPFSEAVVCYIITSHNGAIGDKSWLVQNINSIYDLGWKNFYMVDIAGMDGLPATSWRSQIEKADVIVMGGGANYILSYWLEKSGLLAELPDLLETRVYVGSSAGSMLTQKELGTSSQAFKAFGEGKWDVDFASLGPKDRSSSASLGLIDFYIRPHYGRDDTGYVTDELLQEAANHYGTSIYAVDDESAVMVDGDAVTVVGEGNWVEFKPNA